MACEMEYSRRARFGRDGRSTHLWLAIKPASGSSLAGSWPEETGFEELGRIVPISRHGTTFPGVWPDSGSHARLSILVRPRLRQAAFWLISRYDLISWRGYSVCEHYSNRTFGLGRLHPVGGEAHRGRNGARFGQPTLARDARRRALAGGPCRVSGGKQGRVCASP